MKQPTLRQYPGAKTGEARPASVPVRPVPGWRLPSGQLLVEYALRAGFVSSPLLLRWPLVTPEAVETEIGALSLSRLEKAVGRAGAERNTARGSQRKRFSTPAVAAKGLDRDR